MKNSRSTAVKNSAGVVIEFLIWLIGAPSSGLKLMLPHAPTNAYEHWNKHTSTPSLAIWSARNSQSSCNLNCVRPEANFIWVTFLYPLLDRGSTSRQVSEYGRTRAPQERWCARSELNLANWLRWNLAPFTEAPSEAQKIFLIEFETSPERAIGYAKVFDFYIILVLRLLAGYTYQFGSICVRVHYQSRGILLHSAEEPGIA